MWCSFGLPHIHPGFFEAQAPSISTSPLAIASSAACAAEGSPNNNFVRYKIDIESMKIDIHWGKDESVPKVYPFRKKMNQTLWRSANLLRSVLSRVSDLVTDVNVPKTLQPKRSRTTLNRLFFRWISCHLMGKWSNFTIYYSNAISKYVPTLSLSLYVSACIHASLHKIFFYIYPGSIYVILCVCLLLSSWRAHWVFSDRRVVPECTPSMISMVSRDAMALFHARNWTWLDVAKKIWPCLVWFNILQYYIYYIY